MSQANADQESKEVVESKDLRAYEYAALLYAVGYFLVLLFAWATKSPKVLSSYVVNGAGGVAKCEGLQSVCSIVLPLVGIGVEPGKFISFCVLFLLVLTNLRVIMASMLCHLEGIPLKDEIRRSRHEKLLRSLLTFYVLLKLIALTSLWRAYAMGVQEPWLLPTAFLLEWLLVLGFDIYFWAELRRQQDFKAIIFCDFACLLIGCAWLFAALVDFSNITDWGRTAFLFVFGGLCLPFILMGVREIVVYALVFGASWRKMSTEWKKEG